MQSLLNAWLDQRGPGWMQMKTWLRVQLTSERNSIEKDATPSCDIFISIDLVVENVFFNFRGDLHE